MTTSYCPVSRDGYFSELRGMGWGLECFGVPGAEAVATARVTLSGRHGRRVLGGAAPTAEVLEHVPCLTGLPQFPGAPASGALAPTGSPVRTLTRLGVPTDCRYLSAPTYAFPTGGRWRPPQQTLLGNATLPLTLPILTTASGEVP